MCREAAVRPSPRSPAAELAGARGVAVTILGEDVEVLPGDALIGSARRRHVSVFVLVGTGGKQHLILGRPRL